MITQVYVTIYVYGYLIRVDAVHTTGHSAYHHITNVTLQWEI